MYSASVHFTAFTSLITYISPHNKGTPVACSSPNHPVENRLQENLGLVGMCSLLERLQAKGNVPNNVCKVKYGIS